MNVPREALLILAGLGVALLIASAVGFGLHRRAGDGPRRGTIDNLNARIRAWWVMIGISGGVLLAGNGAIVTLFGFLSFLAFREFITQTPVRRADHTALFVSFFLALPVQYLLVGVQWYGLFAIFIPVYAFLTIPILSAVFADAQRFLQRTAETQWGLMICVYCLSHVPALLTLRIPGYQGRGALLVVFLILIVQASDVLQYIWGKLAGKHKIAPAVSPSKTVEGFVGGIASATLLGASLWQITPFTPLGAAAMALLITLVGFLGGLVMSAIKRDRGIKDWGHLLEGHGGMLDRLDSVCFSAPIFFHVTRYYFSI
ncbi:MAG: phosphatidate cytidylyltransferase [Acidobacteria bacterium]|nr:phosphatidate cytidylyltransferase [Acidobacteriota bacterium]